MGRAVVVGSLIAVAQLGCFAELGAAYYPSVSQQLEMGTDEEITSSGTQVTGKVGFYFDIPIRPANTAVGIGWSPAPMGNEGVSPSEKGGSSFSTKTNEFRLDISAPIMLGESFRPRLTALYSRVSDADVEFNDESDGSSSASGSFWFVGPTMAHYAKYGTLALTVGVARHSCEVTAKHSGYRMSSSGTGIGARLFFTWWPGGTVKFSGEPSRSSAIGSTAGCHYVPNCTGGSCRDVWTCE